MDKPALPLKPIIIFLLILATYISFSHILNHGFIILDDNIYVTENPYVQGGLTRRGFIWAFSMKNDAGLWVPLTWLSLMLDSHFYGLNAGGYHLTNLLFHIINALLVFCVFEGITGAFWQSAFVAFLFALHPLRVESVAWVTERKDVLSTLFFLLTIWAYAFYAKRPGVKRYFPVLLLFTLGLMSKPMLVSVPFVLLLLDYWPLGRFQTEGSPWDNKGSPRRGFWGNVNKKSRAPRLFCEKIPLFSLAVFLSLMTLFTQKSGGALADLELIPLKARIANALVSYVKYILKMLWPRRLAVFYPHQGSIAFWQVTGSFLFLLAVSVWVICSARRPYLFVGWFWYLITLFPVIGLVQAGLQAMADRFTYVPLIGLFIIISWGVPDILFKLYNKRVVPGILAGFVLFVLMICTMKQVRYWQDSFTLFGHTLDVTCNNWLIHNNLGYSLVLDGKTEEGILHYQEALRIRPKFAQARFNLGNALVRTGKIEEGILHYRQALKIRPGYEEAHNNLGSALAQQGKIKEAVFHYKRALMINPDSTRGHFNLGVALAEDGDIKGAISHYKEALRIMPGHVKAHFSLGAAYNKIGDRRGAIEEYKILNRMNRDLADKLFYNIFRPDS